MDRKIKILHLEDDSFDAELIKETLETENILCDIDVVSHKKQFEEKLNASKYDIILSDNTLPDFDGVSALKLARLKSPETKFIFVSGSILEDVAIHSMREGAMDYVFKNKLSKLKPAVLKAIENIEMEKEAKNSFIKLTESEEQYRLLFTNMLNAFGLVEAIYNERCEAIDFKILNFNASFEKLVNKNRELLIGKTLKDCFPQDEINWFLSISKQVLNGYPLRLERFSALSNRYYDFNFFCHKPNQIGMIIENITEKKKYEIEMKTAKEKAEELNKLKTFFLANMSHELRTPLISILGFADLLKSEIENPEQLELVDLILEGGNRLSITLNSILDISRAEALESNINFEVTNIAELVIDLSNSILKSASAKDLLFDIQVYDKNVDAFIDKHLLTKALTNIFNNAVKFTKSGCIQIIVDSETVDSKKTVIINCIDSGVGISEENVDKIFLPFKQASEGYSRAHEGVGLGLTVAQKFISIMHGSISVKSEIGRGSVFTVKIPAVEIEKQIKTEILENNISAISNESNEKLSVLVVEDNKSNSILFKMYLEETYIVETIEDQVEAMVLANMNYYNCVLMDINLGEGIDGIELMKRMKALEHKNYKQIPFIAVTAYALPKDIEKFLSVGFDACMTKPFKKEDLLKTIKKYLLKEK